MKISKKFLNHLDIIGKKICMIETLETRNRDCLDFHDVSVKSIRELLLSAFLYGRSVEKEKWMKKVEKIKKSYLIK